MPSYSCPLFLVSLLAAASAFAQDTAPVPPCTSCAEWNRPQAPFRIFGNTYYVGPHGLSSLLITSPEGHVLIDGAIPESVLQIAEHIRALGFRVEDVKLILNSHVHFDHAGGIAELQRLSGARIAASPWTADVLTKSGVSKDDPQFGIIRPTPLAKDVRVLHDGETVHVDNLALTAHFTPGHTPGGTSWTWESCEASRCATLVYADSVAAVSADGFRFTDSPAYPHAVDDFRKSFAFLRQTKCDILLTPHPEVSGLWDLLKRREEGGARDALFAPAACKDLADRSEEQLQKRLASEKR